MGHKAPHPGERPFFRSYGAGLPSSLTWFLPRTSVYSTRPPVSVCGTDPRGVMTLRRFSRRLGAGPFPPGGPGGPRRGSGHAGAAFHSPRPCPLGPAVPVAGGPFLPRHAIALRPGFGNVDPTPVGYAFRPGLRIRLTLGGRTWPRKPWTFGGADSRRPFRYSCLHDRSHAVHHGFRHGFGPHGTLSYHALSASAASAALLSPDHFRRGITRPVSCYALFKWWLPLSQHPGCQCDATSLQSTKRTIGGLGWRSGLFPSRRRSLSPGV